MKTKKLAAMLITVSMVLGSMSGLVWADTETDSTEPSTEQVTEITDETSEETESSEATEEVEEIEVDEEEAEETEAPEEIDETIETEASDEDIAVEEEGDVYEAEDAYVPVGSWSALEAALNSGKTHIVLEGDIIVPSDGRSITIHQGCVVQVIDLGGFTIDMSSCPASDRSFFFNCVSRKSFTITHGTLTGAHNTNGAGAISISQENTCLTLDDVVITDCHGTEGAIFVNNDTTLNLVDVTITDNSSTGEGAGIRCNPNGHISVDGTVIITNNSSDRSTANYHVDNLHFVNFNAENNRIVIGDNISSASFIKVSGVAPNTVITSNFNGRTFSNIFIFEDTLVPIVNLSGEVSTSGISYIERQWNGSSVSEVPRSIGADFTHINANAFNPAVGVSGTVYIYENMVVADRIYVASGETLNIVIADGVTLTCNGGIGVHSYVDDDEVRITTCLNIYGQTNSDTGVLIANASEDINCAGIGGSTVGTTYYDCGEVYISGCTVRATGNNAAGIGGNTSYIEETETRNIVHGTNFQKVEIYGGNVTAIGGGDYGDDIGTGMDGAKGSGTVSIYGGTVTLPHVNGYQIGVNNPQRITLAPNICVFNGYEYCDSSSRTSAFVVPVQYTIVISPCDHTNIEGENLYTDINDDTHTYHCPYCETVIEQDHTYDNGVCICGHHDSETEEYFVGHAMQLSGQIGLQFYFNLPDGAVASDYRVYFLGNGIDETIDYTPIVSTKTTNGAYYVQLDLNPIQMADHFTPVLHLEGSTVIVAKGRAYCAMDYVTWARGDNSGVSDTELDILEALADYGFYSQIYLSGIDKWTIGVDHEAINLGRNPTPYTRNTYLDRTQPYAAKVDPAVVSCCDRVSLSLRCVDQLMLRVIFYPVDGQTFSTSDFSVLETSNISVYRRSDGAFVVTILDKISVMDVLDPNGGATPIPSALYHVQVNNDSITGQVTVSPMSYAYTIISNLDNSQDCRNLVCAIYEYADACNAYRAQVTTN